MKILVIIFLVVATLLALTALIWTIVDIIQENNAKKAASEAEKVSEDKAKTGH